MSSLVRSISHLVPALARSGKKGRAARRKKSKATPLQRKPSIQPALPPPTLHSVYEQLDAIDRRLQPAPDFGTMARTRPDVAGDLLYYAQAHEGLRRVSPQGIEQHPQLLSKALAEPARLRGVGDWLKVMRGKLGRDPKDMSREQANDVHRTFFELQEALRQSRLLPPDSTVHLGRDSMRTGRGSDLQVRNSFNQVQREIEVTSCFKPIEDANGLHGALSHVAAKAVSLPPRSQLEGSVAMTWATDADPGAIVQGVVDRLNSTWHSIGGRMHKVTLFSNQLGDERIVARLVKEGGRWSAEVGPFEPLPAHLLSS